LRASALTFEIRSRCIAIAVTCLEVLEGSLARLLFRLTGLTRTSHGKGNVSNVLPAAMENALDEERHFRQCPRSRRLIPKDTLREID
jgi:hypothetical protein